MATANPHRRAGSRRADTPRTALGRDAIAFGLGALLALAAWIYLVHAAIDFGTQARGGDHGDWALMALAIIGAIACLFVGLMLGTELVRLLLRTTRGGPPSNGKRAAR